MERTAVVTCFLRNRGEVLLFRRADDADTYPGRWGAVSGYVEHDDPAATARMEVREETAIAGAELVRAGEPFALPDDDLGREWEVHPFLFEAGTRDVTLNEETAAAEWVPPTEILRRETVPELWTSYERVAPTPGTIAADTEHGSAALSVEALRVLRDAAGWAAVEGGTLGEVTGVAGELLDARPSMAALRNRVDRAMAGAGTPAEVERAAIEEIERALDADAAAADAAAGLLSGTAFTLSRSGTVVDALAEAAPAVIVAESRPAREGIGVAEELARAGLDVTVCTDAAAAHVLAGHEVDAVLVGADTVLPDGRVVNKTGTRAVALAAAREDVPFYAVAAADKVSTDPEAHLESGDPAAVYDGPADLDAVNPRFDVTPADLVDGVITERGRLSADGVAAVADELRELAAWRERET